MLHRVKRIGELFIPGVFGLLALIALICVLASCAVGSVGSAADSGGAPTTTGAGRSGAGHAGDGLQTINVADLPVQARTTIGLIESDGPFRYHQDGAVFQNREHLLPRESSGYYHEYTVEMPGSSDRGARRIIKARDGTLYYTSDHYDSFKRITE